MVPVIKIKKITNDEAPLELLLLADPSKKAIAGYLKKGSCFVAYDGKVVVGVYVLNAKSKDMHEIVNIAMADNMQNKGIGKLLVTDAIKRAKKEGAKKLVVGTGNSSLSQLAFYQKCGFRIAGIKKDYFIKNYKDVIFENGIQCKDMIVLELAL